MADVCTQGNSFAYGPPLDSQGKVGDFCAGDVCDVRAAGTVTKLDWLAWTAAVGNIAQRQKLLQWVFDLAESRGAVGGRVPMSDFYDVTTVRFLVAC